MTGKRMVIRDGETKAIKSCERCNWEVLEQPERFAGNVTYMLNEEFYGHFISTVEQRIDLEKSEFELLEKSFHDKTPIPIFDLVRDFCALDSAKQSEIIFMDRCDMPLSLVRKLVIHSPFAHTNEQNNDDYAQKDNRLPVGAVE